MSFPKYRAAGIIDGADWDDFVLNMVAHSLRHVLAGADPIITPLDARAIALTTHGDIVFSGAGNLLTRLPAGAAGEVLQSGGAGADVSWAALGPLADTRGFTIVVSAINSLDPTLAPAAYRCSGAADEVEINAALAAVNAVGGGTVKLLEGTYTMAAAITFPGNDLVLSGMGVATLIDVPDLAPTNFHGIVITGRVDCVVKDLSIQTAGGGGDTVHCIFIENGSDRFLVENVWIPDSDANGIHIEGTEIDYGRVHHCHIMGCDEDGIHATMDAANYLDYLTVSHNDIWGNGDDGVELAFRVRNALVKVNQINGNTGFGVNISDVSSVDNIVENNKLDNNGAGAINDDGEGTALPYIWTSVPNPDSSIGQHQGARMLDGVDTTIGIEIYAPFGFQELVTAQVVVLQIADGASGDMVWTVATDYGAICAGDYDDHEDVAGATTAITQNKLICLDVSAAFDVAALAHGDLVGFEFTRDGDNGSDTLDEPCYLLGLRLRYV